MGTLLVAWCWLINILRNDYPPIPLQLLHWLCREDAHTSTHAYKFPLSTPSIHGYFPLSLGPQLHLLLAPSQHLYSLNYLQDQIELSARKAALQEVETAFEILVEPARLLIRSCHWQAWPNYETKTFLLRSWCSVEDITDLWIWDVSTWLECSRLSVWQFSPGSPAIQNVLILYCLLVHLIVDIHSDVFYVNFFLGPQFCFLRALHTHFCLLFCIKDIYICTFCWMLL